jgi:hypothetical protein
MGTLTEVSSIARNVIKWGTVSLIIMALIPGSISMLKRIYLMLNPPPPPAPTCRYGKLPSLKYPEVPATASPEYKLETVSGTFPSLPNVAKVYLVGVNKARLLVLQRMQQMAEQTGLRDTPTQLDDRTYRFTYPGLPIDMIFDVITEGFAYKYDWTVDNAVYTTFNVPIGEGAVAEAKRFLDRLGSMPSDLANGTNKVIYLAATSSAMVPAISPYDANFARVDLFRADRTETVPGVAQPQQMRVVTSGGDTSPVNVIIAGAAGPGRVVQANYYYSSVLADDSSTYPLIPVQTAWTDLVNGRGFIAKHAPGDKVTVRWISLGYFESNEQQPFLQPVYIFEGDQGFMGYVQAAADCK